MATSFSGGQSRSTWREPPSAPFLYLTKSGANPRRIGDRCKNNKVHDYLKYTR